MKQYESHVFQMIPDVYVFPEGLTDLHNSQSARLKVCVMKALDPCNRCSVYHDIRMCVLSIQVLTDSVIM